MLLFKSYDEPVVAFEGAFEQAAIASFVEDKSAPLLVEMDQSARNKKALGRIFSDQAKPKLLAVVAEVRLHPLDSKRQLCVPCSSPGAAGGCEGLPKHRP